MRPLLHRLMVVLGAVVLTLASFLVLPLVQAISKRPASDLALRSMETVDLPPPPAPQQQEDPQEPEPEEEPPELLEDVAPLDLAQLELALDPGFGEGWMGGDFAVRLGSLAAGGEDVDALFALADLDQRPRVIYQPGPMLSQKVRKRAPGTVYVLFIVDQRGRVERPVVQRSTDPVFDKPALAAVKRWRFEPGKRQGRPVRFRMRVPITFPQEP